MNKFSYDTYTISDSDESIEDHPTNLLKKNILMSPEEPEFFHQVMQRQKRKKSLSPDIIIVDNNTKKVQMNERQQNIIEDSEPNFCKISIQKSNIPEITDSNIGSSAIINEEIIEIVEPKRKKRLTKDEIEKKKKEENARKDAKQKLTEELKRINPKECMKYITVHIDINLQNCGYSDQIISEIQSTDAKFKIELNSIFSNSIKWSRQISDTVSKDEDFLLLIWDFDYVKNLIMSNQLLEKINNLKLSNLQPSIIIYCTTDQLKKSKTKNGQLSRSDMLNKLEQMMLICQVSFRFIENKNDIGLAILCYTKSIAQKPYKLNKYKEEQDGCDWYASGHTKNCVTVDKNGIGLTQLWRQMLSQFPLCALETSEAIASVYGSPTKLLEAYDKCTSRLEGETLLQDIPVRRGFGPLASNRRIGPELSKKLYIFFTDNTGCTTLSQE